MRRTRFQLALRGWSKRQVKSSAAGGEAFASGTSEFDGAQKVRVALGDSIEDLKTGPQHLWSNCSTSSTLETFIASRRGLLVLVHRKDEPPVKHDSTAHEEPLLDGLG